VFPPPLILVRRRRSYLSFVTTPPLPLSDRYCSLPPLYSCTTTSCSGPDNHQKPTFSSPCAPPDLSPAFPRVISTLPAGIFISLNIFSSSFGLPPSRFTFRDPIFLPAALVPPFVPLRRVRYHFIFRTLSPAFRRLATPIFNFLYFFPFFINRAFIPPPHSILCPCSALSFPAHIIHFSRLVCSPRRYSIARSACLPLPAIAPRSLACFPRFRFVLPSFIFPSLEIVFFFSFFFCHFWVGTNLRFLHTLINKSDFY